jgi:alanine-glyoxylate transaminase/serine-glyoxylate transaminase/serine-pyruvate transaminase
MTTYTDLNPSPRILLGPGPSTVHPRVLRAMATPLVGHLDPDFLVIMNEVQELLKMVFQTEDALVIPVSGTGSAGMEASLCNFLEDGDPILICVNGYFGERLYDMAGRYRADVSRIDVPWGEAFTAEQVKKALEEKPAKIVAIVHGETSTGVCQPLEEISKVVHDQGALLLVDAVASLGGVSLPIDELDIDICYTGSQKCLSCPPGLAPVAMRPRALEVLENRQSKVANWYLDMTMVSKYWGKERTYHHTAPISMNYALREALRLIDEEGLQNAFARHTRMAEMLWKGLADLDLTPHVPLEYRLPSLTTVRIPEGIGDELAIRRRLLNEFNIEIAGGLGAGKGKLWRVGLMGYSARPENVLALLGALDYILHQS